MILLLITRDWQPWFVVQGQVAIEASPIVARVVNKIVPKGRSFAPELFIPCSVIVLSLLETNLFTPISEGVNH